MNHGGLGILDYEGIRLPQGMIDLLSIGNRGCLWGLFYPKPKDDKDYEGVSSDLDFMLTPIEPRLWKKSARIVLHLAQKPGTLKKVVEYFSSERISVIHAESSRSAHRYATWSMHIAFEDIPDDDFDDYDEINHVYASTIAKIEYLKANIDTACGTSLFKQRMERVSIQPFEIWPNNALAYFSDFIYRKRSNRVKLYDPFMLEFSEKGYLKPANIRKIAEILRRCSEILLCSPLNSLQHDGHIGQNEPRLRRFY